MNSGGTGGGTGRIVGGVEATPNEFTFLANVFREEGGKWEHACGECKISESLNNIHLQDDKDMRDLEKGILF